MKIFISTGTASAQDYVNALEHFGVEAVGGYLPEIVTDCDGLMLCGGPDIAPSLYGRENTASVSIDAKRDSIELKLLSAYRNKPIFGICRGLQMINAYFGGTLVQDVKGHRKKSPDVAYHAVTTKEGSIVSRLYGKRLQTNSYHHQAAENIAEGFVATAFAEDGTVEAIEHETLPIFAVQWHPERSCLAKKNELTADGIKLFEEFVNLCEKYKK